MTSTNGAPASEDTTPNKDATIDKDPTTGEIAAIAFLLVGPLILLGQAVYWLIYRVWFPLPVSRIAEWLHIPVSGSGSVGEKVEMVLGAPASLVLFVLAIVTCLSVFERSGNDARTDENKTDESRKRTRLAKLMKLRRKKT